ncbi:hypothetical protein O181_030445 [Austropuccinia psidii MF-1]|uniref:Reverse transcriptase Ty1/copia-type domain-containing protein n=1 Tax=Austropuccinia psidii MF-1 TaxID=1389203 RepID=A0A9Q3CX91_9BASI|nr:hypothetical protein [Austropuccinia psidii MF-1]
MTPEADTLDEIGTATLEVVDEVHSSDPTLPQDRSDAIPTNVLLYPRRPQVLVTLEDSAPRTFKGARKSPEKELWVKAIKRELSSMAMLEVWDVVELDPGFKLVGTTWVCKVKKDHLGKIIEHKSQLCAQGFTQPAGVEFGQTYSPTGRLLRSMIAFALAMNLEFHQIDIKSAFLNAPLSETVYLGIPQALELDIRLYFLKLKKAIYGLKQASLAWYNPLKKWLVTVCFVSCILDPCVFYQRREDPIWLYVHVDDIAIFGSNLRKFKNKVSKEFDIKDVGPANLMLSIKVSHSPKYVLLYQQHFTESLLDLYGMLDCNTVLTPLVPNKHVCPASEEEAALFKKLNVNYRSAIGSIKYLSTATRPDLSFAVSAPSQYPENPEILHWKVFLNVMKYLKGTQSLGLTYPRGINIGISAYSDADWGNFWVSQRSVTGFLASSEVV